MIPDHLSERLADYLAGELDDRNRRLFERLLGETDPALLNEVRELRAALGAIDDMAPIREPATVEAEPGRAAGQARFSVGLAMTLAAAVAFAGGFELRGWLSRGSRPAAAGSATTGLGGADPLAETAVVEAFLEAPSDCDFARALVALSRKR